jgi:hypothetical protein
MRQDGGTGEVVQLVENEDYYLDAGLMVLTAHDHLRRGYCCEASPQCAGINRQVVVNERVIR